MTTKSRRVAVLFAGVLVVTLPFPAPTEAQVSPNCAQAYDTMQSQTREFGRQVEAQNIDFARQELADASLNAMKTVTAGVPAADAAFALRDANERWDSWAEFTKETATTMDDLVKCLNTKGCNLLDFAKRQSTAIRLWIQQLASEGVSDAMERVSKARDLYTNYVNQTLSMAQNSMLSVVNDCNTQFERSANAEAVDTTTPSGQTPSAPAPPVVSPGGGGSATKVIVGGVLVAAAAGAALWALKEYQEAQDAFAGAGGGGGGGGGGSGGNTPSTFSVGEFRCSAANPNNNLRTCVGGINVRAGTLLGARQGTTIVAVTVPSFNGTFVAPAFGDVTGTVTLRANVGSSCPPTQTNLGFSPVGGNTFETFAVSIPVICQ